MIMKDIFSCFSLITYMEVIPRSAHIKHDSVVQLGKLSLNYPHYLFLSAVTDVHQKKVCNKNLWVL